MFLLSSKYFEDEFNAFFQCSLHGYIRGVYQNFAEGLASSKTREI